MFCHSWHTGKLIHPFPKGRASCPSRGWIQVKWGMVQCASAIDGCHIPVKLPKHYHTDSYNRKGRYSVIVQGSVDHDYLFCNINIGWPGSVHDAHVLANSMLYWQATISEILDGEQIVIFGQDVPVFLVKDSGYPLSTVYMVDEAISTWCTTNCRGRELYLSIVMCMHCCRECFGSLKARWWWLSKRNDTNVDNLPAVITTCYILHNMSEIHGDMFTDLWMVYVCVWCIVYT